MYLSKTLVHLSLSATLAVAAAQAGFSAESPQLNSSSLIAKAPQVQVQVQHPAHPDKQAHKPVVQIAILLDNSGSMSGLIEQAKSQIWSLVNEFISAKQLGEQPHLQVALFTYGDPPPKMLLPLSNDLDKVSEKLFSVSISGGSEYCGQVIESAVQQLSWSDNPNDLRVIFIAGNEEFTQGPVAYQEACKAAIAKGVIVNTIHCGAGIPEGWRHAAQLADGKAMEINHNQAVVYIESPHDKRISELSSQINKTYLSYGKDGNRGLANQSAQDNNAMTSSAESVMQRAASKANHVYCNDSWDLVDACKDNFDVLNTLKQTDLPENMRNMTREEQQAHIESQRQQRSAIQAEINALNKKRNAYVADKRKQEGIEDNSLNEAMKEVLQEQALEKQITFE